MTTHTLPQTQGERAPLSKTGVFYFRYSSTDPEWHKQRVQGIGGSEVGAIVGMNRWTSPYKLWALKTKRIVEPPLDSEAVEWGNRLEGPVIDKFADEHPQFTVLRDPGTYNHKSSEWQRANPDAIIIDGDRAYILEVKTAMYEDDWRLGPPPSYQAQVQWYMYVMGYEKAYLVVLFHGNKYQEHIIEASSFQQDFLVDEATKFKRLIDEDIEPDFDGAHSTLETVRRLHPDIDDTEVELGDLGVHYFNAVDDAEKAESHKREMQSRVLKAMGRARRGKIYDDWRLTRQARNGGVPFLASKKK